MATESKAEGGKQVKSCYDNFGHNSEVCPGLHTEQHRKNYLALHPEPPQPSVQGEQDWVEKAAKRIDREFIDDAWKWKEIATIIRIFAPTAPSITSERIAEIAKEQFDCVKRVACVADIETAMRKALREAGVRVG